jgi:hypothetical protein
MATEQSSQPVVQPAKSSKTALLVWAILGSTAAAVFAVIALMFIFRCQRLDAQCQQLIAQCQQLEPLAAKARKLPVTVSFRKAVLGAGQVLGLRNRADKSLTLSVTLRNPTFANGKVYRVDLDSGQIRELGHAEGWAITSGDTIEIMNAAYDPVKITVP